MTQKSMSLVMMCSFNYDVIVAEERNDYRMKTSDVSKDIWTKNGLLQWWKIIDKRWWSDSYSTMEQRERSIESSKQYYQDSKERLKKWTEISTEDCLEKKKIKGESIQETNSGVYLMKTDKN